MAELICLDCGKTYSSNEVRWKCDCGGLLDLIFQLKFDHSKVNSAAHGMWRYRVAIPIDADQNILSFHEGFTPLLPLQLEEGLLHVKQDHLFPSGSYKDRGASVLISKAKEIGVRQVVEDSSGNAGCAIAAYCALGGIACDIYVPASTSAGKLAQIQLYGANLHLIPGSRQDTSTAVLGAAEETYYASHSWNPFFFHGTKTFAYELWEQLSWKAPDTVILPAGNGTLLLGAALGFSELAASGCIDHLPRIIAVQSQHCAPLAAAFENGSDTPAVVDVQDTLAEGIAITNPIRGKQIIQAVSQSGGLFITVSEDEITAALLEVSRKGHYIEPTAAATIAGAKKYLNHHSCSGEVIASVFTGHGLKSTEKLLKLASEH